jgi:cytochrome P450
VYIAALPSTHVEENKMPYIKVLEDRTGGIKQNKTVFGFAAQEPMVLINDVKIVEQLYTTHNEYFDKHPIIQNLTLKLTGRSILFEESTANWRLRRKGLSPAFYKGKLKGLIRIAEE